MTFGVHHVVPYELYKGRLYGAFVGGPYVDDRVNLAGAVNWLRDRPDFGEAFIVDYATERLWLYTRVERPDDDADAGRLPEWHLDELTEWPDSP